MPEVPLSSPPIVIALPPPTSAAPSDEVRDEEGEEDPGLDDEELIPPSTSDVAETAVARTIVEEAETNRSTIVVIIEVGLTVKAGRANILRRSCLNDSLIYPPLVH